jgi:hypothetical protein
MEAAGSFRATDLRPELSATFARACETAGGAASGEYRMAGSQVTLRFASAELRERLTPAFAHLVEHRGRRRRDANLTVHLWDSASTGADPPLRPHTSSEEAAGALYHFDEPPLRGVYQPGIEALSVLDSEAGIAWYWVADAADLPSWEQACPIRQILFWSLGSRGYLQVHGAAVGRPAGGVLIVGPAGSGKSTVALACLGSDLLYAGDDYVAVTLEPSPRVASLYNSGKLDGSHVQRALPALLPALTNESRLESEKALLYVQQHFPEQATTGFPLGALLIPAVRATVREPCTSTASRATAFAALAPSTMFQLHTGGQAELETLSSLVERVPCYTLEFGSDLSAIPATVSSLLSRL